MIGKKLNDLIKMQNIKQVKMAAYLNISPSRLSNYLSDKREPDLDMLMKMAKYLKVDLNYFMNMEAATYPVVKELTQTDSVDTVDIPVKLLNAKKYSSPNDVIRIDRKLITTNVSDVLAIELTEDIDKPLLLKGDYLLVCPISKCTPRHGDIIIVTGRYHKAYRVCMYRNVPFVVGFDENSMQKLSEIQYSSVYVVLLFIRRAKND